jgi:hypothetical protein
MSTLELHSKLADSYLSLLKNLSIEAQLDFLTKFSASLKAPKTPSRGVEYYSGCWQSEQSAEELQEYSLKNSITAELFTSRGSHLSDGFSSLPHAVWL